MNTVHMLMRIIGPTATYIGRKTSLWVSVILIYVANIVMMTTDNIAGLYAGRLVIGLGNGFLMTFSQLYIQVFSLLPKGKLSCANMLIPNYRNARRLDIAVSC